MNPKINTNCNHEKNPSSLNRMNIPHSSGSAREVQTAFNLRGTEGQVERHLHPSATCTGETQTSRCGTQCPSMMAILVHLIISELAEYTAQHSDGNSITKKGSNREAAGRYITNDPLIEIRLHNKIYQTKKSNAGLPNCQLVLETMHSGVLFYNVVCICWVY